MRRVFAHVTIGFMLTGTALALTGRELWPFSPYPMYADIHPGTITDARVVGVRDGRRVDIAPADLHPFDVQRLARVLRMTARADDARRDDVLRAVAEVLVANGVGPFDDLRLTVRSRSVEPDSTWGPERVVAEVTLP